MKRLLSLFLILCAIPWAAPITAETKGVQAVVDRTQTDLETPIRLSVTVSNKSGRVDTAAIQDFKVVSQGTSSSVQIINGQMTQEKTFNYMLIPMRKGQLRIPPLRVYAGDDTFYTNAIDIKVTNTQNTPTDTTELFVTATLSDAHPYVGQQVFYTFQLFYGTQIANTNYDPPSFEGFNAKQIGEQKTSQKVINGRRYQVVTLSYLLVPLKSGKMVISPAVLKCDKVFRSSGQFGNRFDSFFDDSFFGRTRLEPKILRTEAIPVTVAALPPYTGKKSFSGMVGHFDMQADLEAHEARVGDSVTLSITIQGRGNIQDATAPALTVPEAFKQYEDEPESDVTLGPQGYQGKKTFRTALVPVVPGKQVVDVGPFVYFDPTKKQYRTLKTQPLSLWVHDAGQGTEAPEVFASAPENGQRPNLPKKEVEFKGRDILPLKTQLDALEPSPRLSTRVFLAGLALPPVLFLVCLGVLNLFKKNDTPAAIMAKKAKGKLVAAKSNDIQESNAYLSNLYRALVYAAFSRAGAMGESLTPAECESLLRHQGVPNQTAALVSDLLNRIEQTRFGGDALAGAAKTQMIQNTQRLVKTLIR